MIRKCKNCNKSIENKKDNAVFCSDICRVRHYRFSHGISDPFKPSANIPYAKARLHPFYYTINMECCEKPLYEHPSKDIKNAICLNCGSRWEIYISTTKK